MKIRAARAGDQADWRDLWQEFLAFYDMKLDTEVTDFTWKRLMSRSGRMKMRLAVEGDRILGFAIYQHHPSTWVMGDDCYLEDLYVAPAMRGQGIGRALINDLIYVARAKGWKRLYWNTEITNAAARRLYDSITPDDGHIRYRMTL